MNKPNNKRSKESQEFIIEAFSLLLQNKEYDKISVSDVCKKAGVNRSTFYAHYTDIYDLMKSIESNLSDSMNEIFIKYASGIETQSQLFLDLFNFVKEYKYFYIAYLSGHITSTSFDFVNREPFRSTIEKESLSRGYISSAGVNYHIAFFATGVSEIFRIWLINGCKESPEEMAEILKKEYRLEDSALGCMPHLYSNKI